MPKALNRIEGPKALNRIEGPKVLSHIKGLEPIFSVDNTKYEERE